MAQEPVVIPEKIYFKIGEVCELVGVQAHVLRYWETEFPMLSPQKNNSGQRSYRRFEMLGREPDLGGEVGDIGIVAELAEKSVENSHY